MEGKGQGLVSRDGINGIQFKPGDGKRVVRFRPCIDLHEGKVGILRSVQRHDCLCKLTAVALESKCWFA